VDDGTHVGLSAFERSVFRSVAFVQEADIRLSHRP